MIKIVSISLIVFFAGVLFCPGKGAADNADVNDIVKKIDGLYRSKTSYARLEMEIVTLNWQRALSMKAWTKGTDRTFIRILLPVKEKGVASLQIKNEMWNYLPKVAKVIKIPPSMMMSSWMGSDFTNDDLVKEFTFTKDYTYERVYPENEDKSLLYIQFTPKKDLPIIWGKVITAVRSEGYLPVWEKYYDEKGNLMRVMTFSEPKEFDGRTIPTVLELVPQNKKGNKTIIRYLDVKFDSDVPEETFSLRNLQSRQQ